MRDPPLSLADAVHVTIKRNGDCFVEKGFVAKLHDDWVEVLSIDSGNMLKARRENVVSEAKMRELRK